MGPRNCPPWAPWILVPRADYTPVTKASKFPGDAHYLLLSVCLRTSPWGSLHLPILFFFSFFPHSDALQDVLKLTLIWMISSHCATECIGHLVVEKLCPSFKGPRKVGTRELAVALPSYTPGATSLPTARGLTLLSCLPGFLSFFLFLIKSCFIFMKLMAGDVRAEVS